MFPTKSAWRTTARSPADRFAATPAGRLKLIFHRDTLKVLGVHIIGEDATELVHIGQAVMTLGGTIDYFIETVFNYPTLAECYKIAAFNGLGRPPPLPVRLRGKQKKSSRQRNVFCVRRRCFVSGHDFSRAESRSR